MSTLTKNLILNGSSLPTTVTPPKPEVFAYPERVLQFGAGAFIRAFVDYYIDVGNRAGTFNGRAVLVQSTTGKRGDTLNKQDGLFTLCVQGLENGAPVQRYEIISSISRTLSANDEWQEVLNVARSEHLRFVVSNTTEVGIALDKGDSVTDAPPHSYPAKLTAVLYQRFKAFKGAPDKGLLIIPCELVDNNGTLLRSLVLQLASQWHLGHNFSDWVGSANRFYNSLVDRIVTGNPPKEHIPQHTQKLGYEDSMLTVAEPFSLWAIQGDDLLCKELTFAQSNPEILIADDIQPYRERKVRILNGTHTATVPAAFLCGKTTVLENMQDPLISRFIEQVMKEEVGPSLDVDPPTVAPFIEQVLSRWRNPFLRHQLINITLQSTSKMKVRVLPSLQRYVEKKKQLPRAICFGFAAYLFFMKGSENNNGIIFGSKNGEPYPINDSMAELFWRLWVDVEIKNESSVRTLVERVCTNTELWGTNLHSVPGFVDAVTGYLTGILRNGVLKELQAIIAQ